jgi:poly(3-hydroxybutyrate) depolymerase
MNVIYLGRLVLATVALAVTATARGQDFAFYEHTTGVRGTRMFVPPETPTIKGVLVYGNGADGDARGAAEVPWFQVFAYLHDFAVIGTSRWGNLSGSEINIWDEHLTALASASGHPELIHAPWATLGFSNGGSMAYGFNALRPEKTIAFIANKGCCYNNRLPSAAALATPGMLIAGELDTAFRRDSIRGLFYDNRSRGARWSWSEEQGLGHDGGADSISMAFLAEAIRLRYPENSQPTAASGVQLRAVSETSGWLADPLTWKSGMTKIWPYDQYPNNKQTASWLLNENMAVVYRAFSTYDRRAKLSFELPFELPPGIELEAWFGEAPQPLALDLDLSQIPDWTKVEVFNYAQKIYELSPGVAPQSLIALELPIPRDGIYGISALVTHADGVTISTTNPLSYAAFFAISVPEPGAMPLLVFGATLPIGVRRRNAARGLAIASRTGSL